MLRLILLLCTIVLLMLLLPLLPLLLLLHPLSGVATPVAHAVDSAVTAAVSALDYLTVKAFAVLPSMASTPKKGRFLLSWMALLIRCTTRVTLIRFTICSSSTSSISNQHHEINLFSGRRSAVVAAYSPASQGAQPHFSLDRTLLLSLSPAKGLAFAADLKCFAFGVLNIVGYCLDTVAIWQCLKAPWCRCQFSQVSVIFELEISPLTV